MDNLFVDNLSCGLYTKKIDPWLAGLGILSGMPVLGENVTGTNDLFQVIREQSDYEGILKINGVVPTTVHGNQYSMASSNPTVTDYLTLITTRRTDFPITDY
ncbi:hypothetical protein [Daejeonella lutea]|uniref:Uncharacterized protein n=1 Tax=Daejeonella lutea TaxID=572036 RepID=A0A1T5ERD2_9SPHI|nr:hypothetical protein [Daejeonella lutea]SKB86418.1 hypothetical protein SAMN05661099_3146 [Daejeonella lutea]